MGAVYKGRQPRLDRLVALKVLSCPPEYHDNFSLRFEREAQVLAKLDHPNIVTIFDFGEIEPDQGGKRDRSLFWFLMDFIDGADLNRLIRTNAMTPEQAFRLVPQICDALQYAHDEGITHRDIKPANILVNQKGRVKIADFGLARLIDGEADALMTGLTLTGTSMGTPHYMAPEQWDAPEKVDHRADIYSLGVVIYEMLTGERPAGVFDPPSRKVQVDVRMDEVVLKAMEKEPERRYQQASEVKEDVTRVVEEPRDTPRMKREGKGKRLPVFAFGGIAVVLLLFGFGNFRQSRSPEVSLEREAPAGGRVPSGEANDAGNLSVPAPGKSDAPDLFPPISAQPRGPLHHVGTGPFGEIGDFSRANAIDDFVDVAGSRDFWVGLRANGETVSSDGSLDASGIAKVCASYHTNVVLIDANGQLHFREDKIPRLPDSMAGVRFVEAQVSHRHGIALDENGLAHVFGEYYEQGFDDGLGAAGYGTPRWPAPPEEALTEVQAVAVAHTHAATLKKDGSLRVFGWEGMVELPPAVTSKTFTRIASSEDQICLLDTEGRVWRFGLARNPHPNQPMGAAGKLLRIGQETATAVGNETWRDEDGRWHGKDMTIDQLLDDHLPGDAPHFIRKWISRNDINTSLLWVEEVNADKTRTDSPKPAPALEIPPPLAAMRERGGRLRAWAAGEQEILGTELAGGIDDFVRLDGLAFPGADRWLAIRKDGPSVTPLADFARSGELVSLDTHLGVLRSGEVLHCWEEQRNLKSRDAIDGETGPGGGTPFWLFLNRDQTVDLTPNGDFRPWRDEEFAQVRPLLESIDDAVQIEGSHSAGIVLRRNGEAVSWSSDEGLIVPDPPVTDAVEVACLGSGRWFSLSADGSIRTWNRSGADWLAIDPPKALPPAFAIRTMGTVCAAQMADGSWRAWGKDNQSGLIDRIESIGPAVDILFLSQTSGEKDALLWIEPASNLKESEEPRLEMPPEMKAMRDRGGRLRSWAPLDDIIGLELAEGIDDFVRLDGILYPNSDRWLAVRRNGASVTPLADFGRSGELVSLDTHLGVLVSGEVVDCFGAQPRKIKPGNVVDSGYAGHGVQFGLFLNRDGTVTLDRAFKDGQWFKNDAERIQQRLAEVNGAIKIDTGPGNGIVLRKSGEIIAWNDDGLWSPDPEITDAVDIAMGGNCWAALRANGSVHTESSDGKVPLPPEGLPPALAIRAAGTVVAAQLADGSWRAWGGDSKLIEQIHAIGPAVDLLFLNQRLLWIEPVGE